MYITGVGSLKAKSFSECIPVLDLCDIPFLPELVELPGHGMIEYPINVPLSKKQSLNELFLYALERGHKKIKWQWTGPMTLALYGKESFDLSLYLKNLKDFQSLVNKCKLEHQIEDVLFLDEPAFHPLHFTEIYQSNNIFTKWFELNRPWLHHCGSAIKHFHKLNWSGLGIDLFITPNPPENRSLSLGVIKHTGEWMDNIDKSLLADTEFVTPSCGLANLSIEQACEVFAQIHRIKLN